MIKEQGFFSLWRGNLPNIYRYMATQSINFAIKDQIKRTFCPYDPKKERRKFFFGNLAAGGVAGGIAQTVVYPLDFARTRLAADIGKTKENREFTGLSDCISRIYKADGVPGLYRGYSMSIWTAILFRAYYFGMYDTGKGMLFDDPTQTTVFKLWMLA